MGTHQNDPSRRALFALTHFKALYSITNHFFYYLFPSITIDNHIIGPPSIISSAYEHFQTKFCVIGFSIQPHKCVTWSPSYLPPYFNIPSQFTTPLNWIIVLRVPLGISSFTSSFIKDAMSKNVWHVDMFRRMGDV